MEMVCLPGVTDSIACGLGAAFLKRQTNQSPGLSGARLKKSTVFLTNLLRNYPARERFIGTKENNVYGRTNLPLKLHKPSQLK
jgi:hypothetical protein